MFVVQTRNTAYSLRWNDVKICPSFAKAEVIKNALETYSSDEDFVEFRIYEPSAIHRLVEGAYDDLLLAARVAKEREMYSLAARLDDLAERAERIIDQYELEKLVDDEHHD